jgi:hypothetical protein
MKMVHTALGIDFWLIGTWRVGELGAGQDVEIVIGSVTACVTFCANGSSWILVSDETIRKEGVCKPKMIRYSVIPKLLDQQFIHHMVHIRSCDCCDR